MQMNAREVLLPILTTVALLDGGCLTKTVSQQAIAVTENSTFDFVISNMTIDPDDSTTAAGFNLDGRFSPLTDDQGCNVMDKISNLDSDQNLSGCTPTTPGCQGGVDNQLPRIVSAIDCVRLESTREWLSGQISSGRLLFLLRLTGVDSLANDSNVQAYLYGGFTSEQSCGSMFSGAGHFLINESSLNETGDPSSAIWSTTGSITDGRLSLRFGTQSGLAAESPLGLPLYQLTIRASLSGDGTAGTNGNAGAWTKTRDMRDYLVNRYPQAVGSLNCDLPGMTDLVVEDGSCGAGCGEFNGGFGLGLRFSMVSALISGTASYVPTGVCGSTPETAPWPDYTVDKVTQFCH